MRWFILTLVALLVVSVTWWNISTHHPVSTTSAEGAPDAATPNDQPPDTSRATPTLPGSSAGTQLSPEQSIQAIHASRESNRAQIAKVVEAGHSKLMAQYLSEPVNGGWAIAQEQNLTSHGTNPQIKELHAEPKGLTAHCRSTTCKLGADFPNQSAADDWVTLYVSSPNTHLSNVSTQASPNPDGSVHIEIYGLVKQ